jgi:carboxyl-terminal processing protease
MNKSFRIGTMVLLPLVTLFLGWQIGATYEQARLHDISEQLEILYGGGEVDGEILSNPEEEVDLSLLWGVWRLLIKHYIEPTNLQAQEMVFGAVTGLVNAIGDPYTVFMTPQENTEFHQSLEGTLEGIGAELTMRDNQVLVVAPLKGSPAASAGLLPEDVILTVDGVDVTEESLAQVVQRIRGPKGTTVKITVFRPESNEQKSFEIVRQSIHVPSVEWRVTETESGSVGVIEMNQFGDETVPEIAEALNELRSEDLAGLVLDIRFNGGGYLEGAVDIASMFLTDGKVVSVERRDGDPVNHYVSGRPTDPEIPMVVLINKGSASASEILAGALQDHHRAAIVGIQSFGKGTVQEVFELPGSASIRITTAKWLTPSGRDIGAEGIVPDITVDRTQEDLNAGRDPQMDTAIEWLFSGEDVGAE